ncbi:hypothetical protein [Paenibacillus sp. y28]|uniref:hypothetical protein n=1 Tax=Paenibacillus sp. y28 TaxID=3129110 RepID=UPI003016648A
MLFWLGVTFVSTMLLTPSIYFMKGKKSAGLVGWQAVKALVAVIAAWLLGYVAVLEHIFSAVFVYWTFVFLLLLYLDILVLKENRVQYKKSLASLIIAIAGYALLVSWIYLSFIYPWSITQDLYQMVDAEEKLDRLEAINIEHIPSVPIESARYKAEKLIGGIENSSYYRLGELTRQKIMQEEYWVAPIEYKGFFESQKAGYIPGYIKVSAERKDEIGEIVKGYTMRYIPSAYFDHNLERRVRSEFPTDIIIGSGFEPNDEGKPIYVVAVGHYNKFRTGTVLDGAVLVDSETGELRKYDLKDVPDFVDFVVTPNLASEYNEWQAKYKHGFWNYAFGKTDVNEVTKWNTGEEVIGVFGTDNRMYWFTDHTSPGTNSMKGYSLMDGRTGKFFMYVGSNGFANGKAALDAVHNTFKKEQWTGTNPLLYNIYSTDTWFVPVIDANGMLRSIALVNAQNPQIVAAGQTRQEALNIYKLKLATEGSGDNTPTNISKRKEITGTVIRVGMNQMGESATIQLLLSNSDRVFNVDPKSSIYATFIHEGDQVTLSYVDTDEKSVSVENLYNETLKK